MTYCVPCTAIASTARRTTWSGSSMIYVLANLLPSAPEEIIMSNSCEQDYMLEEREFLFSAPLRNVSRFRMRNLWRFLILGGGGPFFEDGMRNLLGFLTKIFRGRGDTFLEGGGKIYLDFSL